MARSDGAAEDALKTSEARYRLIADNSSDMIVITRLSGEITYLSPSVQRTGWREEELIGRQFGERMHPDDAKAVARAFAALLDGRPSTPVRWRGRHGVTNDWIWMESRPSVLREEATGKPTGFLDAVRDVTQQVLQEEALAKARTAAEAAAEAKSQFLANMSHEIRTPLTAVIGFTGLLAESSSLDPDSRGYVARIAGASRSLLAVVNDVLDFSKLEAGSFEIKSRPMSPEAIARDIVMMFTPQAESKGLDLSIDLSSNLPASVMLDEDRIRQILINLLSNALKFTMAGVVTLRVRYADARLRYEVTDTGPGLLARDRARLFQRFSQVDGSNTRRHGGTGLGLAIVRSLSDAMGGLCGVTSRIGKGSTFYIDLPAPETADTNSADHAAASVRLDDVRILIVDDNEANRVLARALLENLGAEVHEADGGAKALSQAQAIPVDVILLDLRMEGCSGYEVLAALRGADGPNSGVPVLAFTADCLDGSEGGRSHKFDGIIHKPILPRELYGEIARVTRWEPPASQGTTHATR